MAEEQPAYHIDEASLFRVLKVVNGNRAHALAMINDSGATLTIEELNEMIDHSDILSSYYGSGSPLVTASGVDPENALLRLPSNREADVPMDKIVQAQDNYLLAKGLEGVGFTPDDIQEMESMALFVGHGFKKTVDMTHGIMVSQLWKLHKRSEEIRVILNNTETAERVTVTDKGVIVRYTSARYTDEEKLEWQKELTNIVDQIRRITDSANQGAAIRLKAERASHDASVKVAKKKTKRLKRAN